MKDAYSPYTKEHIATDTPAPWMGRAGVAPATYDTTTHSAFWRGSAWEIVAAPPFVEPVPEKITRRQFFRAVDQLGLTSAITAAIAAAPAAVKIDAAESNDFYRNWTALTSMATALGKTSTDLDNLFRLGATL